MPNWKKVLTSGSAGELSSLFAPSITGSLLGTASYAVTASLPLEGIVTASFSDPNITFVKGNGTSFNLDISGLNMMSASYSATASYVNPLQQNVIITGSLLLTGSHISTVDYIDFTVLPTPPAFNTGRLHWTDDTKTLQLDTDVNNFELEIGHQSVIRGRNVNSFTITKGTVVYINGESGNRPTFATASWEGDPSSATTIGIVAQDINSSQTGYAVTDGLIRGINTTAFTPGTSLYLSSSGQYSSTPAISPLHEVRLGKTITQAVDGIIYVDIMNGYEIGELHDVLITSASTGDLIIWDSASLVWKNTKQLTGSYALTGSLIITGSTSGDLLRITQTGTGNAFVVEDSSNPDTTPFVIDATGKVGIGTTTPTLALTVSASGVNGILLGTNTSAGLQEQSARLMFGSITSSNTVTFSATSGSLIISTGGTPNVSSGTARMYVSSSGNVGIGTSSPAGILDVQDTSTTLDTPSGSYYLLTTFAGRVGGTNDLHHDEYRLRDATGSNWFTSRIHDAISIDTSYKTPGVNTRVWWERDPWDNIQSWGNTTATYMTINAGNVGIGTTTPNAKLDVVGNVLVTGSLTVSGSSTFTNIGPANFTGSIGVTGSTTLNGLVNVANQYYFINSLTDLPTPVSSVITLADNATYLFTTEVDLLGNRLVCGQNTTILGGSSENCRIKSTGLTGTPLISSSYSLPMRGITIEADVALELNASGSTQAIDWFGVNFTNCPTVGLIKNYSNVIWTDCAMLESANLTFDGTTGTVGFVTCLFNGRSGQTIMSVSPTGSITRRFRPIYSSFIALSGETALNVPTSSIVNAEGFILDTCNFSGGGTYISGSNTGSLKSLFVNNVGITNTTNVGHYYMINNTTNTTIGIPNVNVWVKAAGTTTEGIGNSPKWEPNGSNRIDYSGSIAQDFKFTAVGTVQSAANNQVISVGVAKNGTIQAESEVTVRTATSNQPYPFAIQDLVQVAAGDYIEVFVKNTQSTDIRVGDLNVIIDKIGS